MNIKELFDAASQSYDQTRSKYIPCIDIFYGIAIEQIPFDKNDEFSVLELGAGTGLFTAMLIQAFPNAKVKLTDVSEEMLSQAKVRFMDNDKLSYEKLDYGVEEIDGSYNVITSALSIHHIPQKKLTYVFENIFQSLMDDGVFINADQILGRTNEIEKNYEEAWLKHAKEAGCTEEEIKIALERMKADKTTTLSFQMDCLEKVGFKNVNCWYQFYRFATYSGIKSR